jgi:hypothetical protein
MNMNQVVPDHVCRVQDTVGSALCTPCALGKYSTLTGRSVACDALCERGRYATGGNTACDACPAHTYTANQGSNLTNCTCNFGFYGPDGRECMACISGTYKVRLILYYLSLSLFLLRFPNLPLPPPQTPLLTCNRVFLLCLSMTCRVWWQDVNGSIGRMSTESSPCTQCARGKYSTEFGEIAEDTCTWCPPYSFSMSGSNNITNCTYVNIVCIQIGK